jgi:hypothetical protein
MVVSMLNRGDQSDLTLENVLHAPLVGYTLLRALDTLGRHIAIGSGDFEIKSHSSKHLTLIMWTVDGAWAVLHVTQGGKGAGWSVSQSCIGPWRISHLRACTMSPLLTRR